MKKGDKVKTSGKGVTAKWPREYTGTVIKRKGQSVFVVWDGGFVEDEMFLEEVEKI